MRRWIAVLWQASFFVIAGVLYFLFVLPRWNELTGDWSHSLGTAMRIVAGVLIGLAALPVVFTLIRTRKPEYGTPAMALSLRTWSIVLHVLGGVLIVGAAVSEIWLSLDGAGQWMFGIYGAAAAIALLGALAFYLAYIAETAPPPPKPLKPKERTRGRRGRRKTDETDESVADEPAVEEAVDADAATTVAPLPEAESDAAEEDEADKTAEAPVTVEAPKVDEVVETDTDTDTETPTEDASTEEEPEEQTGKLRNRRPSGKTSSRLRRRSRGGVALED
jgi:hypothetical protein